MRRARITGLASHTPSWILTNAELVARFDLSVTPEWIEKRTGILSRHWLPPELTTSDMAAEAAKRALAVAGRQPEDVDRVILATVTPDRPSPSTATTVIHKIGARCMAFDVQATCAGFLYGLELGRAAIAGGAECVLVIAADVRSRYADPSDHRALVLFADGAGAAVLEPADKGGIIHVDVGAEGASNPAVWIPAGGAAEPTTAKTVAEGRHWVRVERKDMIFDVVRQFTLKSVASTFAATGMDWDDIDLFVFHQGNANLTHIIARELGAPADIVWDGIAHHGNMSGASIAVGLVDAWEAGRLGPGKRALLASVGAGFTWGSAVIGF